MRIINQNFFFLVSVALFAGAPLWAAPVISAVTMNSTAVGLYQKLEITFQVTNTQAVNLQWPYDPAPPPGVTPGQGISVDAVFTEPNGQTVTQPAFYYEDFQTDVRSSLDWIYPTGNSSWKVRFSPTQIGSWQVHLVAQDSSGTAQSAALNFTVGSSGNHGFVRVSKRDSRYFEFDDGTYFPGLGYNTGLSEHSPIQENLPNFQAMGQYGIQLIRFWLMPWSINASDWNGWTSFRQSGDYIPYYQQVYQPAAPGSETSMQLEWDWNPMVYLDWGGVPVPLKQGTKYHIFIRYLIPTDLVGPGNTAYPNFGLCAKINMWLDTPWAPGTGNVVTAYANKSPKDATGAAQWSTLEGQYVAPLGYDYIRDKFYLVMENMGGPTQQFVYIDRVEMREDLGNGQYGPNIIPKPWMSHHMYFQQKNSFAFDKVIEMAEQYGVYLKLVVLEKNDWVMNSIDYNGNFVPWTGGNSNFYGNWRTLTKVRWLQQAWWQYLQARWGYSPNIHSWELLNEGDPFNGQGYVLADELGKYMRQFAPEQHLVSTSFWASYPLGGFDSSGNWDTHGGFWINSAYPNIDYADVHQYTLRDQLLQNTPIAIRHDYAFMGDNAVVADLNEYYDTASATKRVSMAFGAKVAPFNLGKPIIRGETGFVRANTDDWDPALQADTGGVWLHNFVWGHINPGGLIDLYWHTAAHIFNASFDNRWQFGTYYSFIKDVPLSNGNYMDAAATVSTTTLRAWGQKDPVNGRAHLWIANIQHTWWNVVNGVTIAPVSGTVQIPGLKPTQAYAVTWWDTYQTDPTAAVISTNNISTDNNGVLTLSVTNLTKDLAVKIQGPSALKTPGAPRGFRKR